MTTTSLVIGIETRIPAGLTRDQLLDMYYKMLLSRRLDERMWVLHRQGKIAFHISGLGQEGAQVGAAFALKPGFDFVHPYYRDMALVLSLGVTPRELMLAVYGKKGEPSSGARQMPAHYGYRRLNIVSGSSPVTTQVPQAAGIAFGELYKRKAGLVAPDAELPVVLTCLGEGATSQGDFHEALTWAGVYKLPLIVMVENNLYAISVPINKQSAVTDVSERACAYGVAGVSVDGNDFLATYQAMKEAVERARSGGGATLLEAKTYRPVPHSSDDDDRSYRTREEVEEWKKKGPILRAKTFLMEADILSEKTNQEYEDRVTAEVDDANKFAEAQPYPDVAWGAGPLYAPASA
jgi:2-oxoisovalerate dehydrogenase E1 component alpha subunit